MAFSLRNLSVLAYANGFTLWLYKAGNDGRTTVVASGFFQDAGDMLTSGDMVLVSALDGGHILSVLSDGAVVQTTPLM